MKIKRTLIIIFSLVVLALLAGYLLDLPWFSALWASTPGPPPPIEEPEPPPEPTPDIRTARLVAAGDIIVHLTQVEQAFAGGSYDFTPSFSFITPSLQSADLTVGNFETVLAGPERGYSGYPAFNTPDELAQNLKQAGFDLLSTANNHSLDMGINGLFRTIDCLEEAGLVTFGTYRQPEERTPLLVEVNGINLFFTAYTESTNGIPVPDGYDYAINYIPNFNILDPIINEITVAREKGADLVIVYMHWGHEYHVQPTDFHRDLARQLAIAGADMIIGGHPHVMQPLEWITVETDDGPPRQVLVAYSLGNFISNQFHWVPYIPTPKVQYGLLLDVEISKDMESGLTRLSRADYDITWVHRNWRHRILPLSEVLSSTALDQYNLTEEELRAIKAEYDCLREEILEKYNFSD
ncbi:MAG: CapA family protein [Firmicutes bacterium]|nr:CapA family protein [Bacillota bacterium]